MSKERVKITNKMQEKAEKQRQNEKKSRGEVFKNQTQIQTQKTDYHKKTRPCTKAGLSKGANVSRGGIPVSGNEKQGGLPVSPVKPAGPGKGSGQNRQKRDV